MTLMAVAAAVCLIAQYMNRTVIHEAHKTKQARIIYGDSVTADTPLIIYMNGIIQTIRMDELVPESAWIPYHNDKECATISDLQVWQDGGFTAVHRIIRHMHEGPIIRIQTYSGVVDCTTDHSLLTKNGEKISPINVNKYDELLHALDTELIDCFDKHILSNTNTTQAEAFIMGVFAACGICVISNNSQSEAYTWSINNSNLTMLQEVAKYLPFQTKIIERLKSYSLIPIDDVKNVTLQYHALFYNKHQQKKVPLSILHAKIDVLKMFWKSFHDSQLQTKKGQIDVYGKELCAGVWLVGQRLGFKMSLNCQPENVSVFNIKYTNVKTHNQNKIKKKFILSNCQSSFVYDLETESHHFHVAPGNLVVHNTDSTFTQWNISDMIPYDVEATKEQIWDAIVTKASSFAEHCSKLFPLPNHLEFEALKSPILLGNTKKLHCSVMYGPKTFGKWDVSSISAKGPAFKKRDRCEFVQQTGWEFLSMLMYQLPQSQLLQKFQTIVNEFGETIPHTLDDLKPYTITSLLGTEYKTNEAVALYLAETMLEECGSKPKPGTRLEYVVAQFSDDRKRYRRVVTPQTFLRNTHILNDKFYLDYEYYLNTQLLPPLGQLIQLHDPALWKQIQHIVHARAQTLELRRQGHKKCF